MTLTTRKLTDLPDDTDRLRAEAEADGFRLVSRLVEGFSAGTNRFDRPGEVLLGVFAAKQLVATGGLNIDPYCSNKRVGRLRHLYVLKSLRRRGVASALVAELLRHAEPAFDCVRVYTDTREGEQFYSTLGFAHSLQPEASHFRMLRPIETA